MPATRKTTKVTRGIDALGGAPLPDAPRLGLGFWVLAALVMMGAIAVPTARADAPDTTPVPDGVQLMCPVMRDEKIDPDISLAYQGRAVYFCCQKCRWKFEASPQRYASSIVTLSGPGEFEANDHDHEKDHGRADESTRDDVLTILGKLHPMAVHFPIALLISAALARCLMRMGWSKSAGPVVRFCVLLGGVSAVAGAGLGWINAGNPATGESLGDVIFNHRWLGVATAVVGVLLIVLVEWEARKPTKTLGWLTTLGLLVGAGLVGVTGHFGGILVYGPDYLPW